MGCDDYYRPAPSEGEVWLSENGFTYERYGMQSFCVCRKCGSLVDGSPSGRRFLELHMTVCPGRTDAQATAE